MKKLIVATTAMLCVLMTFPSVGLALQIDIGARRVNFQLLSQHHSDDSAKWVICVGALSSNSDKGT